MGWCTARCKMLLFCVITIVKESLYFELAHLKKKKKKKEKHFGRLAIFWFGTFAMLFHVIGLVVHHETLEDEWYIAIRFTVFEILKDFFVLSYIACLHYHYI